MIPTNSDEIIIASSQCHCCYFRPQVFYQKVESWHCTESKLDIKMNFETGENHTRFLSDSNPDQGDSFLLSQYIENATKIVPDSEEKDDAATQSMIKRGDEAEGTILPDGSSVFELLRNNDMNGMARRLEALINRQPENQSLSDILYREN